MALIFLNELKGKPNIIFLLADDQATISMGCYGNKDVVTPNLDRLSRKGLTFDNHYVTTAICMASRASILTGSYEYQHGCNFNKGRLGEKDLDNSYPVVLKKAGYITGFAGKFGINLKNKSPEEIFDWWGGGPGQTSYATKRNISMKKYADKYPHSTISYGAFGRDFINHASKTGKPFCLSISFKAPHMPDTPDKKYNDVYKNKTFQKPANFGREYSRHLSQQSKQGRQWERWETWGYKDNYDQVMQKYHQLVYGIDQATGMILSALEDNGLENDTIIIYTSDNGFLCGSHGYGSKVLPYEESVRVPMIIYDPRLEPKKQGKRIAALTANLDIAPTIIELAGQKKVHTTEGISLVPLFTEGQSELRHSLAIMNCWGPIESQYLGIVTRKWKYINWFYGEKMVPKEELFNMEKDKYELINAAEDERNQRDLEKMRALYDQEVSSIKKESAFSHKIYGALFDRTIPWQKKRELIQTIHN